jgi:hypothetical protein
VVNVNVVGSKPPLNVTVAPLMPVPLELVTVPWIFPAVEIVKFSTVFPPEITVAVLVCDSQPLREVATV